MKSRYILAGIVIAASIAITPYCVREAAIYRGYAAYGGEYMMIPMGFILAVIIIDFAKMLDRLHQMKKKVRFVTIKDWEWDYGRTRKKKSYGFWGGDLAGGNKKANDAYPSSGSRGNVL